MGDEVVVDGVPTKLTSVDFILGEVRVLKITFQPDEPVAVFHQPDLPVAVSQPSIHSHGHKPKKIRRGGKHYHTVKETADAWSIPDTQGYYSDCNLTAIPMFVTHVLTASEQLQTVAVMGC